MAKHRIAFVVLLLVVAASAESSWFQTIREHAGKVGDVALDKVKTLTDTIHARAEADPPVSEKGRSIGVRNFLWKAASTVASFTNATFVTVGPPLSRLWSSAQSGLGQAYEPTMNFVSGIPDAAQSFAYAVPDAVRSARGYASSTSDRIRSALTPSTAVAVYDGEESEEDPGWATRSYSSVKGWAYYTAVALPNATYDSVVDSYRALWGSSGSAVQRLIAMAILVLRLVFLYLVVRLMGHIRDILVFFQFCMEHISSVVAIATSTIRTIFDIVSWLLSPLTIRLKKRLGLKDTYNPTYRNPFLRVNEEYDQDDQDDRHPKRRHHGNHPHLPHGHQPPHSHQLVPAAHPQQLMRRAAPIPTSRVRNNAQEKMRAGIAYRTERMEEMMQWPETYFRRVMRQDRQIGPDSPRNFSSPFPPKNSTSEKRY